MDKQKVTALTWHSLSYMLNCVKLLNHNKVIYNKANAERRFDMFVGRKRELAKLEDMYQSDQFEFAVVYGRRRIGKTTLINKFCENKKVIYFVGIESTEKENLESLSKAVFEATMPGMQMPAFESFEQLFEYVAKQTAEQRLIFVIDEYPYLAESSPKVSSILQAAIDKTLKNRKLFLILCGSSMSFMEHQVLGYKSPLYGRRTAQFKVLPFTFFETRRMLENYSNEDQAVFYGVTGGIPEYLARINPARTLDENIISLFFDASGRLFEEPSNLLKQELRDPAVYNAIISSIAEGSSRLNEISTKVGIATSACSNYLTSLIELGLVKKEVPVTEKSSSRKTIYLLEDQMFRFWYKFVAPNLNNIVAEHGHIVYEKNVKSYIDDFMGFVFELICTDYMNLKLGQDSLPFFYSQIGRWWGNNPEKKRQEEIDILAYHQKQAIFGECKWRNEDIPLSVYQSLLERSNIFSFEECYYYIFSKSGFTESCQEAARNDERLKLVSFSEICSEIAGTK